MFSIRQLKKYLYEHHHIKMQTKQIQIFRNLGYYHGYKGYRFIKEPSKKIIFSDFSQVIAINEFDMQLKSLFYPKVMYIETALKNYVIEAVMKDAKSENLDVIFAKSLTNYKNFSAGSSNYKKEYMKRMILQGKINKALIRDYGQKQRIVKHFFDSDRNIPIWAVFESLTLGEFGAFFSCANVSTRLFTSALLKLPKNLDSDGVITEYIIYAVRDLRNSIAHNNVIFDVRFQTGDINRRLVDCLKQETGISPILFNSIADYIILIVYVLRKMGVTKTECKLLLRAFLSSTESLRSKLPTNIYNKIISTDLRARMKQLEVYITKS